jgi:ketosteroid isomerase-like protein
MAEQPNVQLIRDANDAFGKGDMETLEKAFADDVVVHFTGRNPLAGDRRSRGEFFELLGQIAERFQGTPFTCGGSRTARL